MADPTAQGFYVSVPSRSGAYLNPGPILSPRLGYRNPDMEPLLPSRLQSRRLRQETNNDEDYVKEGYEGSLVHYYPAERKVTKLEKKIVFTGNLAASLGLNDFLNPEVWRAAISEFVAMTILIFVSTAGAISCLQAGFTSSSAAIGLVQFLSLSFMILAAAPASGGHLNPAITIATMLTGFSTPARAVLYVIAQTGGSALGAVALKVVVAEEVAAMYSLGGCLLRATVESDGVLVEAGIGTGAGLLAEFIFTLTLLYFAFSVALDPKQFQVTGPILAPFMIGAVIGMLIYVSGGLMEVAGGYTGAGLNPARCFGPAVAMGGSLWTHQWVFWVGPLLACVALAVIYHIVPPHHVELYRSRQDIFTHIHALIKYGRPSKPLDSPPSSSSKKLLDG